MPFLNLSACHLAHLSVYRYFVAMLCLTASDGRDSYRDLSTLSLTTTIYLRQTLEKKREDLAALIVVHMFGHPAHMDEIRKVAAGIPIIEDCAHSLFSKYKGTYTGLLSTASFFSFRSGKYVSAGEAARFYREIRLLLESIAEFGRLFKARKLSAEPLALHGDICQISCIPQTLVWCGGLSDRKMA